MMSKPTLISITPALLCGVIGIYLFHRHSVLQEELAAKRQQCQEQMAGVEQDFRQQLNELQQYLITGGKSGSAPMPTATKTPDNDDSDAPDAIKNPEMKRYNESLKELVARKYRFLLAQLNEADKESLQQLLVEREGIALRLHDFREYGEAAGGINPEELETQLAEIDSKIQELLSTQDYQRYDLLRDSDNEQEHFTQFTLGISGLFPMNNGQQESVLLAKARHERAFETQLKDLGLYADSPLTRQQKDQLFTSVQSAAAEYKRSFLQEIRQYLDTSNFPFDQYTLVENYTNTEFQEMVAAMQKKIEARPGA
jgi:hypothetical protein